METISVVIPAHNEEDYIGECLKSVTKNPPKNLIEVVVVNNLSTDGTERIAKQYPLTRVVFEKNKGITYARQRGLLEAKGDLLAYIDADTHISNDWFNIINREFEKNKNLVCLSGPYIYYDIPLWEQWFVKKYWNLLAHAVYHMVGFMVVGGNFVAKKSALEEIGGFDTTITFYGEDTNIGRRLSSVGKVRFARDFKIYTSGRRINSEGIVKMGLKYGLNFSSEAFFHKQFTKKYKDIR